MTSLEQPEAYLREYAAATTHQRREALRQAAMDLENKNRELFATSREDAKIQHPYVTLLPVHAPAHTAAWTVVEPGPADNVLMADIATSSRPAIGQASVVDKREFELNFKLFTEGSLALLDFNNIFVAGGCIQACLNPIPESARATLSDRRTYLRETYPGADIDLFIYGLDEAAAKAKMLSIYQSIVDAQPHEALCFRTTHAVTIVSQHPWRHIQIVLRLYASPAEVLTGFDVDSCAVGYDGEQVWASRRAHSAFVTGRNIVDHSRRSPSYEVRLAKYAARGFAIDAPGFERGRVDPQLYERSFDKTRGLARLLLFEAMRSSAARLGFKEKQRERKLRPAHENAGNYASLSHRRDDDLSSQDVDANDYNSVFIPFGPLWNARRIAKLAHRKDYVLNSGCDRDVTVFDVLYFADPNLMHKFRSTRHHQHPLFYGTMMDVLGDCCRACPPVPPDVDPSEKDTYVSGELTFIVENPGRQSIGSFHPIENEFWTEGAYIPEDISRVVSAVVKDDVDTLDAILKTGAIEVDHRDWLGRTPLLLAVFCNSVKCVKHLLSVGAKISLTLPDGRNPLHLCCEYGLTEIAKMILAKNVENKAEAEKRAAADGASVATESDASYAKITKEDAEEDGEEDEAGGSAKKAKGADDDEEETEDEDDVIDLEFADWDSRMTPFCCAILHGHANLATMMLQAGASAKAKIVIPPVNSWSKPTVIMPYRLATFCVDAEKRGEILRILSKAKVPLVNEKSYANNLLHDLIDERDVDVLKQVLEVLPPKDVASAINALNEGDTSPLGKAVATGRLEMARLLLEYGAKPFHSLAECERAIKKMRLNNAYNWKLTNNYKSSAAVMLTKIAQPLENSLANYNHECLQLLIKASADVNQPTSGDGSQLPLDHVRQLIVDIEETVATEKFNRAKKTKPPAIITHLQSAPKDSWKEFSLERISRDFDSENPEDDLQRLKTEFDNIVIELAKDDSDEAKASGLSGYGQEAKEALQHRQIRRAKLCEQIILNSGGKTFAEMFPDKEIAPKDAKYRWRDNSDQNLVIPADADPIDYIYATMNVKGTPTLLNPESGSVRYRELFEAAWAGDVAAIKKLTIEGPPKKRVLVTCVAIGSLNVAYSYYSRTANYMDSALTPFQVAVLRGHTAAAEAIAEAAIVQRARPVIKANTKGARAQINNYKAIDDDDEDEDYGSSDNHDDEEHEDEDDDLGQDIEDDDEEEGDEGAEDDDDEDEGDDADNMNAAPPTSKVSLLTYFGQEGGKGVNWATFGLPRAPPVNCALSALGIAVVRGDLAVTQSLFALVRRVASIESQFLLEAHAAGAAMSDADVARCQVLVEGKDNAFAVAALQNEGKNITSVGVSDLLSQAILGDNANVVDFLLRETLGNIDVTRLIPELALEDKEEKGDTIVVARPKYAKGLCPPSFDKKPVSVDDNEDRAPPAFVTVLHVAAVEGSVNVISHLVKHDMAATLTALSTYGQQHSVEVDHRAALLIREDAPILKIAARMLGLENLPDREGVTYRDATPLHWAVEGKRGDAIAALGSALGPSKAKELGSRPNRLGELPIHVAACSGFDDCIKPLVDGFGGPAVVITSKDKVRGWNAIHFAACNGRDSTLRLLLGLCDEKLRAALLAEETNKVRHTAAMLATINGRHKCLEVLREFGGASVDLVSGADVWGLTPLHWAVRKSDVKLVQKLLDADKDHLALRQEDGGGHTPFETAVQTIKLSVRKGRRIIKPKEFHIYDDDEYHVDDDDDEEGREDGLVKRKEEPYEVVAREIAKVSALKYNGSLDKREHVSELAVLSAIKKAAMSVKPEEASGLDRIVFPLASAVEATEQAIAIEASAVAKRKKKKDLDAGDERPYTRVEFDNAMVQVSIVESQESSAFAKMLQKEKK